MLEVFEVACLVCMAVIGIAATVIVILNNTNVASSTVHIMHCCIDSFSMALLVVYVSAYFMLDSLELIYGSVLRVVTPAALLVLAIAYIARLGATISGLNNKIHMLEYDLEESKYQLNYTRQELANTARKLADARMYQTAVSENTETVNKEAE